MRQTLALELRLKRELERADREAREEVRKEAERAVERRKARVSTEIERVIWNEYEPEEAEAFASELTDLLRAEALDEAFTTEPLEAQIERICKDLGIPSPFNAPSPLAGEGVGRSPTDEGSHSPTGPPNPWT